jgi:hypothetical protein
VEVHKAAELFPMLPDDKLEELTQDIRQRGLIHPIITYQGQLLDGRNRWEACARLAIMPRTEEYKGDDPIGYVVSANIQRRHLTVSELGILGKEVEEMYLEEAKKRMHQGGDRGRAARSARAKDARMGKLDKADKRLDSNLPPSISREASRAPREQRRANESIEKAAKVVGVTAAAISAAKRVEKNDSELYEEVKAGRLSVYKADDMLREKKKSKEEPGPKKVTTTRYTNQFGVSREAPARRKLVAVISYLETATQELDGVSFRGVITEDERKRFGVSLTKLRRIYRSTEAGNA